MSGKYVNHTDFDDFEDEILIPNGTYQVLEELGNASFLDLGPINIFIRCLAHVVYDLILTTVYEAVKFVTEKGGLAMNLQKN